MNVGQTICGSGTDWYGKYLERGDIVVVLGWQREEQYSATSFYIILPDGRVTSLTWSGGTTEEHTVYFKRRISPLEGDDFCIPCV